MIEYLLENIILLIPFFMMASAILFAACFWHLNFKHIEKQQLGLVSAIISVGYVFIYGAVIERMVVEFAGEMIIAQSLVMGAFFVTGVIFLIVTKRSAPSLVQMMGPFIFFAGYFLLLAK